MDDVEKAEQYAHLRVISLAGLGLALLFGLVFAVQNDAATDTQRAFGIPVYWLHLSIMAAGAWLIATGGGLVLSSRVMAMANDEGTRAHRRTSIAIGFWTALAIGLGGYLLSFDQDAPSMRLVSRSIVQGGEAMALLAFAWLEHRAARG